MKTSWGSLEGDILEGNFKIAPSITVAAHELKSPLSLIRQLSLALMSSDITESERQVILQQIRLTSDRALRLTSDLTKSSRLADAMFKLEPINPYNLCREVAYDMRPLFLAHKRDIRIRSIYKHHGLLAIANRDLLRRILINFVDNALCYTPINSTVDIRVSSIDSGGKLRLSVRDYGQVPLKNLKMTTNLNSINESIVKRPQSSGLGVYIANQFADIIGGEVGLIKHNNGTSFFVDLKTSRQMRLI